MNIKFTSDVTTYRSVETDNLINSGKLKNITIGYRFIFYEDGYVRVVPLKFKTKRRSMN